MEYNEILKRPNSYSFYIFGNFYFNQHNYSKARKYYELSDKQNSCALYNLGNIYLYGLDVHRNYSKAREYYELSAKYNNSYAINKLGDLYLYGLGVKRNYPKAKEYYEKSAEQNNPDALYNLGNIYYYGFGVKRDYSKAKMLYEFSAMQNNLYAINKLGDFYYHGLGVIKDYFIARKLYELSAKQNNSYAINKLGDLYYYGYGVEQNYSKAREYYEISAKQNNPDSFYQLSYIYKYGLGVNKSFLHNKKYISLSLINRKSSVLAILSANLMNGAKESFFNCNFKQFLCQIVLSLVLGYCYYYLCKKEEESTLQQESYHLIERFNFGNGIQRDYLMYKNNYDMLNQQNIVFNFGDDSFNTFHNIENDCDEFKIAKYLKYSKFASTQLGKIYEFGLDETKYIEKAIRIYQDAKAYDKLGDHYLKKMDNQQNYSKAIKLYNNGVEEGDTRCFYCLGKVYEKGKGVPQDYLKAKEYYEKASYDLYSNAFVRLGNLYERGKGVQQDYKKALKYYILASQLNNQKAFYHIAVLYLNGDNIDFNLPEAINYFFKYSNVRFNIERHEFIDKISQYEIRSDKYFYSSQNELGLIYLLEFNDIEKAEKYLLNAGLSDYPFGQNNLGLLYIFYQKEINNPKKDINYSKKFLLSSSENAFALSDFILGYIDEKENNTKDSIQHYINASENEDKPLCFRNRKYYDKRLEISKKFIICCTNLKLSLYYFTESDLQKSKKYFVKAFSKISSKSNHSFSNLMVMNLTVSNLFKQLKKCIFNFPEFNLINQPNLSQETKIKCDFVECQNSSKQNDDSSIQFDELQKHEESFKSKECQLKIKNSSELNDDDKNSDNSIDANDIFVIENEEDDPIKDIERLFDFIICKGNDFCNEIKNIIDIMEEIIFSHPYPILFGRIYVRKPKYPSMEEINDLFYAGFELYEKKNC